MELSHFTTRKSGAIREAQALKFLRGFGYRCITRNFSCKFGEIDLIVTKPNEILVFVEVRYRNQTGYGRPAETVTYTKQSRLRKTAAYFLQQHKELRTLPCRFDVIAISHQNNSKKEELDWIENAFY